MIMESSLNCCCRVTDRWWLVAGRRRVGTCDLDLLLVTAGPLVALIDVALLTSLFGGNCAGLVADGWVNMGAAEPCKARDGESGPTLDRGLLLYEV